MKLNSIIAIVAITASGSLLAQTSPSPQVKADQEALKVDREKIKNDLSTTKQDYKKLKADQKAAKSSPPLPAVPPLVPSVPAKEHRDVRGLLNMPSAI